MEIVGSFNKSGPLFEGGLPEKIERIASGALEAAAEYLQGRIVTATPSDTSNLRGSILATAARTVGAEVISSVATNVEYGTCVEEGSKPHMPPIGPLMGWVKRHSTLFETSLSSTYKFRGSGAKRRNMGRRKNVSSKQAGDALRRIAWAIAINIKKHGTSVKGVRGGPTGGRGFFMFGDTYATEAPKIQTNFIQPMAGMIISSLGG